MSANIEPPKYGSLGMLAVVIFILAVLMTIVRTAVEPGAKTTYQPDPTSFNHRYITERFRQEGYSQDDSVQAADAVVRFHEAQKRRKRK